jgi:hypothetical protein
MLFEVFAGLSVVAIAVLMFPYLRPYGQRSSLAYLLLKGLEGGLMIIAGGLYFLHSKELLAVRDNIYMVHGYIFALPALLFYALLYKSKLLPRWLSLWGVIAALILIVVNALEVLGVIPMIEILYLPIVLNELVLALWLIFKGFDPAAIKDGE